MSNSANTTTKIEASKRIVDETKRLYANLLLQPLDEKLLARPPFKFIQDLVKSLIKEAKILRDVFTPNDFDLIKKSWDKRAKVEFIQKLIDFAAINKQPVTSCVAARVVAGLEPNKTNELLQALAKIAHSKRGANNDRRPRTFVKPLSTTTTTSNTRKPISNKSSPIGSAGSGGRRIEDLIKSGSASSSRKSSLTAQNDSQQQRKKSSPTSPSSLTSLTIKQTTTTPRSSLEFDKNKPLPQSGNNEHDENDDDDSIVFKQHSGAESSRSSSSSKPSSTNQSSKKQSTTAIAASESDIVKGIQFVRLNLRSLRNYLIEIDKLKNNLRNNLQVYHQAHNKKDQILID